VNSPRIPAGKQRISTIVFVVVSLVCFAVDLGTKQWALARLEPGEFTPLLGRYFGLELVFNPGAAFSFLAEATWIFTIIAVVVVGVILWLRRRVTSWPWMVTLALLLGGTLGNLSDRFFRQPGIGVGHVVDFLNYYGLFVGNVADIFIVFAAVSIAVLTMRGQPVSSEQPQSKDNDG